MKNKTTTHKKEPKDTVILSKKEYEELKGGAQSAEEHWDKYLRLHAEFDNVKKRMEREKQEFIRYANADIICELLGILDNLERAIETASKKKDFDALYKGIEMILDEMRRMLEKKGVSGMECVGQAFDPVKHEAVTYADNDEQPEDTVIEELQKGYVYNDKVVRPAKVKLARKTTKDEETKDEGRR